MININGNIPVQLCEEDRKRLDVISDTLELIRLAITKSTAVPIPQAVAADQPADPEADFAPEEEAPAAPQEAKDEPSVPWVTMADIQKKIVDLTIAGKKSAVKKLLQAYATKVSAIPEDKYAEVLEKLTALEG